MKKSLNRRIKLLRGARHPYFPSNDIVDITYEHSTQKCPDLTEQLHSSSYLKYCFDPLITEVANRKTFDSICELSSGNNDLGYFRYMLDSIYRGLHKNNYHLSNYSGGRGDYFTLQKLCGLENSIYRRITGNPGQYNINRICLTFAGQGAYSALAAYFSAIYPEKEVVFFDSSYCSNYKPFSRKDLKLGFVQTPRDSHMPSLEVLLDYLKNHDCIALFFVKFHNPSGELYNDDALREIIKTLKKKDAYLLYSEAYETLDFKRIRGDNSRVLSILRICEELDYDGLVRVKTLSKDRGFAGLRAGYMLAPEELVRFTIKFNDEISYNPPMINDQLFVLNTYLQSLSLGCEVDQDVEEWLDCDGLRVISERFKHDDLAQLKMLHSNFSYVVSALVAADDSVCLAPPVIETDDYEIVVPEGGINLSVRLKFLEGFDQLDVFRKVFLETGLILHSSQFICKKQGYWIRITLSHNRERLQRGIQTIQELKQNLEQYQFLPEDTLKVRLQVPHRDFDRGVVMSSVAKKVIKRKYKSAVN